MTNAWFPRSTLGFSLALGIVVVIGFASSQSIKRLAETAIQVVQSNTLVTSFETLLSQLKDAQRGVYGYIITGDQRDLDSYDAAVVAINRQIEKLRQLIPENPEYQHRLERIAFLVAKTLDSMKEEITLRKNRGTEATTSTIHQGETKKDIDEITRTIWDMESEQIGVLAERTEAARKRSTTMLVVIALGHFLAFALVLAGIFIVRRELAARQRAEEEAQKATVAAEVANRAKGHFLASMSHEIRTPLNAILGMDDLLTETSLTVEQREYVRISRTAGDTLLNLLNDILDFSKIEAGRLDLEAIPFDLREVLESTNELMAVRAHVKDLEFSCRLAPQTPTALIGDPDRLRQILVNLLGNAVKFTDQGEIVVEVHPLNSTGESVAPSAPPQNSQIETTNSCVLQFSVRDTGVGIPADKLRLIFESFSQADSSTTRRYGGTGLGLAISKRLVELMGGRIWVDSQVGQGSTFFFTLPLQHQLPPVIQPAAPTFNMTGCKALIIDDHPIPRLVLRELLTSHGVSVTEAASGAEGIAELTRSREAGEPHHLLFLDSRLTDEDPFRLAINLKTMAGLEALRPIMLTCANHLARCRALGLVSLAKPFRQTMVLEVAQTVLAGVPLFAETTALPRSEIMAKDLRRLHLLVAEDDTYNRVLIQVYLQHLPYLVDMAENGKIAVEKFASGFYDLVFMDIDMPEMDGYTATKAIRAWETEQKRSPTPIVALTASALKEEIQVCLDAGCTAHLAKPIKKAALIEALYTYVGAPSANSAAEDVQTQASVIVRLPAKIQRIVPQYLQSQREAATLLLVALEQQDYRTVQDLGHKMKGTGGSFGFDTITDIGRSIEEAAKAKDVNAIRRWRQELTSYLDRIEVVSQ